MKLRLKLIFLILVLGVVLTAASALLASQVKSSVGTSKLGKAKGSNGTLDTNLTAWFRFDQPDSTTDSSNTSRTLTFTSSPTFVPGLVGQAVRFDGTSYANTPAWTPSTSTQTYALKFKTTRSGVQGLSAFSNTSPTGGVSDRVFRITAGNKLEWYHTNAAGALPYTLTSAASVNDGQWHCAVVTMDGGSTTTLHLDGVALSQTTSATGYGNYTTPRLNIASTFTHNGYAGEIDDYRVWHKVLSSDEITQYCNSGKTKLGVSKANNGSLSTGLIAHWTMNGPDSNTTQFRDISGNNITATRMGGTVNISPGMIGQATHYHFNETAYLEASSALAVTSTYTVSAWVKLSNQNLDKHKGIFSINDGGAVNRINFIPRRLTTGLLSYWDANNSWKESTKTLDLDRWYHVVWVVRSASSVKFYVNGVFDSEVALASAFPSVNGTMWIGRTATASEYYDGALDELRLWNRALTADEITQIYNAR